jgi:hypothetical protein
MLRKIFESRTDEKTGGWRKLHDVDLHTLYSFIHHSSMALEPFVGPWPLPKFRNVLYRDDKTPLDECLVPLPNLIRI